MTDVSATVEPAPRPAGGVVPTLRQRRDFLRLADAPTVSSRCFSLKAATTDRGGRFGFTVTRKAGSATERNRIRRRLREAARRLAPCGPGRLDVVIIARRACLTASFADVLASLDQGLQSLERRLSASPARSR